QPNLLRLAGDQARQEVAVRQRRAVVIQDAHGVFPGSWNINVMGHRQAGDPALTVAERDALGESPAKGIPKGLDREALTVGILDLEAPAHLPAGPVVPTGREPRLSSLAVEVAGGHREDR